MSMYSRETHRPRAPGDWRRVETVRSVSPRVKVCGIRSAGDLTVAVASGADAVGFLSGLTHRSEDALTPEQAAELVAATPPYVCTVLVTQFGARQRDH